MVGDDVGALAPGAVDVEDQHPPVGQHAEGHDDRVVGRGLGGGGEVDRREPPQRVERDDGAVGDDPEGVPGQPLVAVVLEPRRLEEAAAGGEELGLELLGEGVGAELGWRTTGPLPVLSYSLTSILLPPRVVRTDPFRLWV